MVSATPDLEHRIFLFLLPFQTVSLVLSRAELFHRLIGFVALGQFLTHTLQQPKVTLSTELGRIFQQIVNRGAVVGLSDSHGDLLAHG